MIRYKYGITFNTDYKLTSEEYMYIAIMILVANMSIGIGLLIGWIITLML